MPRERTLSIALPLPPDTPIYCPSCSWWGAAAEALTEGDALLCPAHVNTGRCRHGVEVDRQRQAPQPVGLVVGHGPACPCPVCRGANGSQVPGYDAENQVASANPYNGLLCLFERIFQEASNAIPRSPMQKRPGGLTWQDRYNAVENQVNELKTAGIRLAGKIGYSAETVDSHVTLFAIFIMDLIKWPFAAEKPASNVVDEANWREPAAEYIEKLARTVRERAWAPVKQMADLVDATATLIPASEVNGISPGASIQFIDWPFGMHVDLVHRKVERNGKVVEFESKVALWEILQKLAESFPEKVSSEALRREASGTDAVYKNVAELRKYLAKLGVTVTKGRGLGYTLADSQP
jgi:hypothetical protein